VKPSLRGRIGIVLTAVLILSVALYAASVYVVLSRHAYRSLDLELHEEAELAVRRLERAADGTLRWHGGAEPARTEEEPGGAHWLEIWDPAGVLLLRDSSVERRLALDPPTGAGPPVQTIGRGDDAVRVLVGPATIGGRPVLLRVARSERPTRQSLHELLLGLLALLPVVLAVFGGLGHWLVGRLLAPLHAMADGARRVTAHRLSERLPLPNTSDEVGELAEAFNDTLGRLEMSFDQLRRFTDDASHELRTPLTVLRSVGEVALTAHHDEEGYREVIGSMLEEVDHLTRLVDTLLTLARADAGKTRLQLEALDLGALVRDVVAHLSVLAEERGQRVEEMVPGRVEVRGDRVVLRQAIVNLVDNAIKYCPEGSCIRVGACVVPTGAVVEVADEGPGIPESHRERIFDRFHRIDRGRSREKGGTGLGLALVKWAAEAHGGRVELSCGEAGGSRFRLVIPA
jgi:heavy metal sensor kinase